jgi:uncharacterized protein (TIGR03118 family)
METAAAQSYTQTNLVSNAAGAAHFTDAQLSGPIGLARASGDEWWVSDSTSGVSTLYIGDGTKQTLVVTIPPASAAPGNTAMGTPSGVISSDSTTDFPVGGAPSRFVFSTLDGAIAGWNPAVGVASGATPPSTHAEIVATGAPGSVYTAIASAFIKGKRYLYVANFGLHRIDVYDSTFRPVRLPRADAGAYRFNSDRVFTDNDPFVDNRLPAGYSPYNVQAIGNDIVVAYAFHPDVRSTTPVSGMGLGYVDVFSAQGVLLGQLEHGDFMNAPYGIALAPLDFGRFSHDVLVAQTGTDNGAPGGVIAAFDIVSGKFDGDLQDTTGKPLVIPGLRGIAPGNSSPENYDAAGAPAAELYFTSFTGQGTQTNSLFGFLTPVPADLIKGSDQ